MNEINMTVFICGMVAATLVASLFWGLTMYEKIYMEHGYVWVAGAQGHWELRNGEKK